MTGVPNPARARVLIVEDDAHIRRFVRLALEAEGHEVHEADGLKRGLIEAGTRRPDLIVLDLGLPDGDGVALIRDLRSWSAVPVIVLSARSGEAHKISALDSGADDYLVKPFALAELLSRMRALMRRSYGVESETLELRGLCINEATRRVLVEGVAVELSRSEFELLAALVKRCDRVLTRTMLEEQVLPGGGQVESNVLDVHISSLRRKIGEGYIRTVRGVGYVIDRAAATPRGTSK